MLPIIHHPDYQAPLTPRHRFPMGKYAALRAVLLARGLMKPGGYLAPSMARPQMLARAHDPGYVSRALSLKLAPDEVKRIGLPQSAAIFRRGRLSAAGTTLAAMRALEVGVALNTAGGSHHAGPQGGAGFCTFNDVAVAILALRASGKITRALIVDCDAHQGDGTARIFAADPDVFTLSLHGASNYPFDKARSDLDIALPDGTGDAAYLEALSDALEAGLRSGPYQIAFYNAGVDVHAADRLGRLALSDAGLRAREHLVLQRLRAEGLPIAVVIGGGYGEDVEALAARHAIVFEEASLLYRTL
ncbi:MAG: histone deacetylase [Neomegalonema sp.]|nr:histone deacetylase [Neomegalonema sp.]